ncbi:MAG: hypothetical protein IT457_08330 [Planctomycetes bacterium]|nr:hypothetical protein [Planctomycetota bacterium]
MSGGKLARLAARFGETLPVRSGASLDAAQPLLALDDPLLDELLGELLDAEGEATEPLAALRDELAAFAESDAPIALFADSASARARMLRATRAAARPNVLVLGGRREGLPEGSESIPFAALATAPARIAALADSLASVVLEPRGELALLRAISAACHAVGARVLLDESRTAGRVAARGVGQEAGLDADAVLLGESIACGLPFAAVIGITEPATQVRPFVACVVRAALQRLALRPVHDELSRRGSRLRTAFTDACRAASLRARLLGPAALVELAFETQQGIDGERLTARAARELAAEGSHAAREIAWPATLTQAEEARLAQRLQALVRRMQQLLVQHDSWLGAALPWPFPDARPALRGASLVPFRHPKATAATLRVAGGTLELELAAAELGPGGAGGCWLPFRLTGDFELRLHYALRTWSSGDDAACFSLFAQAEAEAVQHQVQVGATRNGNVFTTTLASVRSSPRAAAAPEAWLSLARRGDTLLAACRALDDEAWTVLDERRPVAREPLVLGCSLAARGRCGGLQVAVLAFLIEGELAPRQGR